MKKLVLVSIVGLGLLVSGCSYTQGKEVVKEVRKVVDILPIPPATKAKIIAARIVADGADKLVTTIQEQKKGNDAE